ncbi:T9SS type A sorting domain-containing protein [Microvirga sp. STR05]|uniref:T9SS type A sorting domain-containing protein n=1 Tax=Hymenobacter duratus TaxID=2771356 RepID=A0ABR8JHS3_9BACT|nr:T9SS type A sorting domain-containing protein [Hymenobacter duratus]MBD2714940.1 T9SS type A sorting domain-containing protein [Hymenobacter duratus]MBR7949846.1 T9SS type A sorting domain-containing protein [Microvirga sp. STR05]
MNSTTRQRETNNIIVINSAVVLDQDYSIEGGNGLLTVNAGGSLIEDRAGRRLSFGSQQGNDKLRLVLNGTLQVTSLSFYKADAEINASLRTSCNISVANQSTLEVNGSVTIEGNLIVRQGNPTIEGTGQVNISGCVLTNNNGSLNGLFGPNISVCVQGTANACDTEGLSCNPNIAQYITIDGCRAPLPVELRSFSARNTGGTVQIVWTTATEKNSDSFLIERAGESKEFVPVTSVAAAGSSQTLRSYSAIDRKPLAGNNYYRLKQIDKDGTFAYSPVVNVLLAGIDKQDLNAYGTSSRLNIQVNTPAVCQMLRVMDSMGRVVYTENMPTSTTGVVSREVPLSSTGSGVYIVQAITNQGTISRKFMLAE